MSNLGGNFVVPLLEFDISVRDVEPMSFQSEPMDQHVPGTSNNFLKVPDEGWFASSFRNNVRKRSPSPKRKTGEYAGDYAGYLDLDDGIRGGDVRPSIKAKLEAKTERDLGLFRKAFGINLILKACLEPLTDWDLKLVSSVSKDWLETSIMIRRERLQNKPSILVWRDANIAQDQENLIEKFSQHFQESWFKGFGAIKPVDTIISFGTSFLSLGSEDFLKVPALLDGRVKFVYAAGGHLTCTLPGKTTGSFIRFHDSSVFALQTLCIPRNPEVDFLSMAIPAWTNETKADVLTALTNTHHANRDYLIHACGKVLKGMLIFLYFDDKLAKEFAESYCIGAQMRDPSELGIIIANQDGVASSDAIGKTSMAALLAIHGSANLRLAAYGFRMTAEYIFSFGHVARKFFYGAKNKFIVMVYIISVQTDNSLSMLKQVIGDDIPMIGIETYSPIIFYGNRLGLPPTEDIEVALFLVAY